MSPCPYVICHMSMSKCPCAKAGDRCTGHADTGQRFFDGVCAVFDQQSAQRALQRATCASSVDESKSTRLSVSKSKIERRYVRFAVWLLRATSTRMLPPVMLAAANENEAIIGLMIAAKARLDIATRHPHRQTLATVAAANRNEKVMELLLAAGMPIDNVGDRLRSPCHIAALNPNEKVLALLLAAGCDFSQKDVNGETPCHMAAKNTSNAECLRLLLDAGADPAGPTVAGQKTPLHHAAANTNDAVIALLLPKVDLFHPDLESVVGVAVSNPNERVLMRLVAAGAKLYNLASLCAVAAANPNPALMRMVLDAGAVKTSKQAKLLNAGDALLTVAKCGSEGVAAMLMAVGAKHRCPVGLDGTSICHIAALNRDAGVMRQLIMDGCLLDVSNCDKKTPCRFAVEAGNLAVVSVLVAAGADVNSADVSGTTLCHRAARLQDASILRLLLRHGARCDAIDERGLAPVHHATAECVAVLFAAGANVDARDKDDVTPCLLASSSMEHGVEPLLTLLAAGADIEARDRFGRTPIDVCWNSQRAVKRGLLTAARGHRAVGWNDVTDSLVEWSTYHIGVRRFELMRLRGLEICNGLQARQLSAVELCAILENMNAPNSIDMPFHTMWSIVTTVKHFLERRQPKSRGFR